MKPLLLSTFDTRGGAARAAYRLHRGLRNIGLESQMLVQEKSSDDWTVIAPETKLKIGIAKTRATIDSLPLYTYRKFDNYGAFFPQWIPDSIPSEVKQINPDILNLHWISGGFIQIESLKKLRQPLVLTLHDMWAFTGGCHYSQGCDRYIINCGKCPQLHSRREKDLSKWVWERKAKAWQALDLTIVTPSNWLADVTRASSLLGNCSIQVIPNGLDTKTYKPLESKLARDRLQLPQNKQLILFGAMRATSDPRKGWQFLQPTLQYLKNSGLCEDLELVVFGASEPKTPINLGFPCHYLGELHDDVSLSIMYAAVDLLLVPSTQDNLPNTVMEAISCGTPCVAFDIGGIPDMIQHKLQGYLAKPFDCQDLANGIDWVLRDAERCRDLQYKSRQKALQEFDQSTQAQRYQALFENILELSR
ncbi:glycosyltransferase family 4 protein [Pseudanabaena sp. FACHB-723]|uniref:Glycosyltransferase family 4 protein n=1 Tax=Pseudanabaena mucicola FACHB-723 TaxID=2692860 RepID=A0ABR7ZW87_9CYAN|nr:glycosyltransferase family 4 protein [Pseudanabaena mucicola FACHB-723]